MKTCEFGFYILVESNDKNSTVGLNYGAVLFLKQNVIVVDKITYCTSFRRIPVLQRWQESRQR